MRTRRHVAAARLKVGLAALLVGLLVGPLSTGTIAVGTAHASPGVVGADESVTRQELNFNTDWRYRAGEVTGAHESVFDDARWGWVNLPHNTKFNTPEDVSEFLGASWYRKRFTVDPAFEGKLISLQFEGAMQKAEVWVNGALRATHVGGYTPFSVDLTGVVQPGIENVVAVRVDSTPNAAWAPGKSGIDFRYFGGIYRDVKMLVTDPVHITDAIANNEVAGGGVFITTPTVSAAESSVQVRTDVDNGSESNRDVAVRIDLKDAAGTTVASSTETAILEAGASRTFEHRLTVTNAQLWHPEHPNLYRAEVNVLANGVEVDRIEERFGIRRIDWSHEGLFINGERFKAIGANKHPEIYGLGNAVHNEEQYLDVKRVKEAGFDFIRTSHFPNDPSFYEAADELGVLVLNGMTGWQTFYDTEEFRNNSYKELRDMIRRDRNHPSVVAWETSLNESHFTAEWANTVHSIAHAEFPGDQMFTAGWLDYFDILVGASQAGIRTTDSTKPIIISEWGDWDYGGNSSTSRVSRESYDLPGAGGNNLVQTANHQEGLNKNLAMNWFSADGLWDFADMSGYNPTASLMGVTDYYRINKFGYYFFKSQRDADVTIPGVDTGPMAFIANTWSADSPTSVSVYSNAEQVRLYKNDALVETRSPDTGANTDSLPHPPFTFNVGAFAPGELRAEALIGGQVVATASRKTAGEATSIELKPESDQSIAADGASTRLVFLNVTDSNGTTAYRNAAQVDLTVSGSGKLVGPSTVTMKGGQLAAWVRAGRTAGEITITASSPGLSPASTVITTREVPGLPAPQYDESEVGLENVAEASIVTASSETPEGPAGHAVDSSDGTAWIPASGDPQPWLAIDLGKRFVFSGSRVLWSQATSRAYELQVSNDGIVWDPLVERRDDRPEATSDFSAWTATGRYVRANLPDRQAAQITGVEIYGVPASAPVPVDVAQEKASVVASSFAPNHDPAKGNNGNPVEYWQAARAGKAWWAVDLGARYTIDSTIVTWLGGARAYQYTIEVSNDGVDYRRASDQAGNITASPESQAHVGATARFVRISIDGGTETSPVGMYNFKVLAVPEHNVAARKTATSSVDGTDASLANDLATGTAWQSPGAGATWQVDFGTLLPLSGVDIRLGKDSATGLVLEGSHDGESWTTLADRTSSTYRDVAVGVNAHLRHLRVRFPAGQTGGVAVENVAAYDIEHSGQKNYALVSEFDQVSTSASYTNTGGGDSLTSINDGRISFAESGNEKNVWTNWSADAHAEDSLTVDFGAQRTVNRVGLHVYTDHGAAPPSSVALQYFANGSWTDIHGVSTDGQSISRGLNTFLFEPVATTRLRVVLKAGLLDNGSRGALGVTELEVFGDAETLEPRVASLSVSSQNGPPSIDRVGGSLQLTATAFPATAGGGAITWTIETTEGEGNIATIDQSGSVTGASNGIARVTALSGDGWNTVGQLDVTVNIEESALRGELVASIRCIAGRAVLMATLTNSNDTPIAVAFETEYGSKQFAQVSPGKNAFHAFTTRQQVLETGSVKARLTALIGGAQINTELVAQYPRTTC